MTKFTIFLVTRQMKFNERYDIKPGCSMDQDFPCLEKIKVFYRPEDAFEELKKYKTSVAWVQGYSSAWYEVEEYIVKETEIDEDGEETGCVDIIGYSKLEIAVVRGEKTLATFDNYRDAARFYNNVDDDAFDDFGETRIEFL